MSTGLIQRIYLSPSENTPWANEGSSTGVEEVVPDVWMCHFFHSQLRSLAQGECQQALKSLQAHYEDFLQDSRDSELFSVSDRLRLEEEVESSKEHIQQLLESMENGELQRA